MMENIPKHPLLRLGTDSLLALGLAFDRPKSVKGQT